MRACAFGGVLELWGVGTCACEKPVATMSMGQLFLKARIELPHSQVDLLAEDQPEAVRHKLVPALIKGVASHHAGHLPGWKALVEKLFQR